MAVRQGHGTRCRMAQSVHETVGHNEAGRGGWRHTLAAKREARGGEDNNLQLYSWCQKAPWYERMDGAAGRKVLLACGRGAGRQGGPSLAPRRLHGHF